ncbi:MAG: redoxin family protein [Planctomycetes bacterium]|nr:redoxin family protein [Planctomycetota bacterium]
MAAALSFLSLALFALIQEPAPAPLRLPSARDLTFVSETDLAGKVLYVEVARTTCARCAAEAPIIQEIRAKYGEQGFEVVTVYDEIPAAGVDPFEKVTADANRKGYAHPIALNDGGEFHDRYYSRIRGTPSAFLISRGGKVTELGLDPLADLSRKRTETEIEKLLAEPKPQKPTAPPEPTPLGGFSLLSYRGGVVRAEDLRGKPSMLVAWIPGPLTTRLGPPLESIQTELGGKIRILAVTFGDFDAAAAEASRVCPSVELVAPDSRTASALGADRLPQILFVDEQGRCVKRIQTLYGSSGIEAAVLKRIARALTGAAPAPATPAAPLAAAAREFHDSDLGFRMPIASGFREMPAPTGARFRMRSDDSKATCVVRHLTDVNADSLDHYTDSLSKSMHNYRVVGREKLDNGGWLLDEEFDGGDGDPKRCRGSRLFVPTPQGLLEVYCYGALEDHSMLAPTLRSTAMSVRVDHK